MLNHILNGLSAVGNVLDLPGSSVRDVLVGKNPFDQYLTPMSHDNRASGRDVARHYGVAGNEDTWGNFAGGLGVEIATDPLNLIGAGALKAAKPLAVAAGRSLGVLPSASQGMGAMARARRAVTKVVADPTGVAPRVVGKPIADSAAKAIASKNKGVMIQIDNATGKVVPYSELARKTPAERSYVASVPYTGNAAAAASTSRHEISHAIRHASLTSPQVASELSRLPMSMRVPANMMASKNPYIRGAGIIGDEVAALMTDRAGNAVSSLFKDPNVSRYAETWGKLGVPDPMIRAYRAMSPVTGLGLDVISDPAMRAFVVANHNLMARTPWNQGVQ